MSQGSDVFISYAAEDRDWARHLAEALTSQGWSVWWDRTILPGQVFDTVIGEALENSRCVVVLWSTDSVDSNWVKEEAAVAMDRGVLVPAQIDEAGPPLGFGRIQTASLVGWAGGTGHEGFDQLCGAVQNMVASEAAPPATPASSESGPLPIVELPNAPAATQLEPASDDETTRPAPAEPEAPPPPVESTPTIESTRDESSRETASDDPVPALDQPPPPPVDGAAVATTQLEPEPQAGDAAPVGTQSPDPPPEPWRRFLVPVLVAAVVALFLVIVIVLATRGNEEEATTTTAEVQDTTTSSPTTTTTVIPFEPVGASLSGHEATVLSVDIGVVDGGTVVASGSADRTVRLWNAATGEQLVPPMEGHEDSVDAVALGSVGGEPVLVSGGLDGAIRLWDPRTGASLGPPLSPEGADTAPRDYWVPAVALGDVAGTTIIASGHNDAVVRLWDPATGSLVADLVGHEYRVGGVAFGEVGGSVVLATAGIRDNTVRMWDLSSYQEIGDPIQHPGWVVTVASGLVDDRAVLATGGEDGKVRLWDATTRQLVWQSVDAHTGCGKELCWIESVAFGRFDGRDVLFSGGEDGLVRIWDPATGDQIEEPLEGHAEAIYAVSFGRVDGHDTLASGSRDTTVWLWDLGG